MGLTNFGIDVPSYIKNLGHITANDFRNSSYESDFDDWDTKWQQISNSYTPTVTFETDRFIRMALSTAAGHGLICPYFVTPIMPGSGAEGVLKYVFDVAVSLGTAYMGLGLCFKPVSNSGMACYGAIWYDFYTDKLYVVVDSTYGIAYRSQSDSGTIDVLWTSREITNYDKTKRNVFELHIATSKGTIEGVRVGIHINGVLVEQSPVIADTDMIISDGCHPYFVGYGTSGHVDLYAIGVSR